MQLFYLYRPAALEYIKLADAVFLISCLIVKGIIALDNTGCDLDHGIFSDKRIHNRLENKCGLCFCEIIIRLKDLLRLHIDTGDLSGLRRRHIADNIIK